MCLPMVVTVPAGASPSLWNLLPPQQLAYSRLELRILLLAASESLKGRPGRGQFVRRMLVGPARSARELRLSGGANGVQSWCRHGHWEADE